MLLRHQCKRTTFPTWHQWPTKTNPAKFGWKPRCEHTGDERCPAKLRIAKDIFTNEEFNAPLGDGMGKLTRRVETASLRFGMIEDDTLMHLLCINDDLLQICKRLKEKRHRDFLAVNAYRR